MRKGYWKILLRRLRGRIDSGFDTFTVHQTALTVAEVLASGDDALDPVSELPLARLAGGAMLTIDIGKNLVLLRAGDAVASESTDWDLPAFIDALAERDSAASENGMSLSDAEPLDLSLPRRKPFIDD